MGDASLTMVTGYQECEQAWGAEEEGMTPAKRSIMIMSQHPQQTPPGPASGLHDALG